MPKESCQSDLRIERYENRKRGLCFGFQRAEKKEEEKKKKRVGRRAADSSDRRRTRVNHRLEQRSSSEASTRVARKSGQTATRAEPTGPADPRLRGSGRAYSLRLAPSRVRGHALLACCWRVSARGTANLARLLSVCPIFVPVPVLILFLRE